jgi:hypothetical protein
MDEMRESHDLDENQKSVAPKDSITGASHAIDSGEFQDSIVIHVKEQQPLPGMGSSEVGQQTVKLGEQLQNLIAAAKTAISATSIELPGVTENGKERVNLINGRLHGEWESVNERELELLMRTVVFVASQVVGAEQITHVTNKVLSETSIQKTLQQLETRISELEAVANQVTDKIASVDAPDHSTLRWLVLGGAILLAVGAGAIIPLVAGAVTAEVILTNEVAIAAVVFAAATLLKDIDR